MAVYTPGGPTTVTAEREDKVLEVAITPENLLKPGKYRFQLIVEDDGGNKSPPAGITVLVLDTQAPTAVVDFIDPNGTRVPDPEVRVPMGNKFSLTGERSTDIGGEVIRYTWELLQG